MKIAVSTYSYSQLLSSGEINQLDCISLAKRQGFEAVEIVDILPHDGSNTKEYAEKIACEAYKCSIAISNFTFGADFLNNDPEKEVERVCKMIDLAEIIGAKSVRHDGTAGLPGRTYKSFEQILPELAMCCRKVTQYAKSKGIKTMIENHGHFCQDSERVEKLVNYVDDENFGLLVDMGNFLCVDERPEIALGRVAPYAFYVHAKDFHIKDAMGADPGIGFFKSRSGTFLRGAVLGHGNVPIRQCLYILKQSGYDGYVAVEFEGMERCNKAVEIGLNNLQKYLSEI